VGGLCSSTSAEICGNGIDDDGNGLVDEGCPMGTACRTDLECAAGQVCVAGVCAAG
jgi:Cys-rich repeat protein